MTSASKNSRARAAAIDDGQYLGVRGSNRDITERKRAEEALRESKERYQTLFDSMTEGFSLHEIVTDQQGRPVDYRFLEANPAFERLTGLKRADLVGKRVLEVLPDTEACWIENFGRVALTGEPVHFESFSSALGRWYEVFAYRPAPRQFAVISTDITARQQAADESRRRMAELRAANEELSRFNVAMVDRELRMIELKKEINALLAKQGMTEKYRVAEAAEPLDP